MQLSEKKTKSKTIVLGDNLNISWCLSRDDTVYMYLFFEEIWVFVVYTMFWLTLDSARLIVDDTVTFICNNR